MSRYATIEARVTVTVPVTPSMTVSELDRTLTAALAGTSGGSYTRDLRIDKVTIKEGP